MREVSRYIYKTLSCFGLYDDDDFPKVASGNEEVMSQLMNVLCKFRDDVKNNAKDENAAKILFKLSDELRDDILPHLGIQIEDKKD